MCIRDRGCGPNCAAFHVINATQPFFEDDRIDPCYDRLNNLLGDSAMGQSAKQMLIQYIQDCEFSIESALKIIAYMSRIKTYEDVPDVKPELLAELREDNIIL